MTLEVLDTLLQLWYQRQEDPDVEATFKFQRYPDKEGGLYSPKPRKRLPTPVQQTPAPTAAPPKRGSKRKEKSRKRAKTARAGGRKKSESEGEDFPGLTDQAVVRSDDDDSMVAQDLKELERPKVARKIKPRPISKKKKQLMFEDEMTDDKLENLDPELQSIHDDVISKGQKKMGPNNVSATLATRDPIMPKVQYRFGPVSRGGAGKDFVGIITGSAPKATEESPQRKGPNTEDNLFPKSIVKKEKHSPPPSSSRKRRHEETEESPPASKESPPRQELPPRQESPPHKTSPPRKKRRTGDDSAPTVKSAATAGTTRKNQKNTSREGGGNSPVKKQVTLQHDRQTRSSKAQGIQTRSQKRTR